MKERPIIFSAAMVLALLEGRKMQTRRLVKPQPRRDGAKLVPQLLASLGVGAACPYGEPGDRLYVRESLRFDQKGARVSVYCADGAPTPADCWPWKRPSLPSIHMPKGLSRLKLELVDVRIEQLVDISEADAKAEGAFFTNYGRNEAGHQRTGWSMMKTWSFEQCHASAVQAFAETWVKINGPGSWNANPWVWVLSFRVANRSAA